MADRRQRCSVLIEQRWAMSKKKVSRRAFLRSGHCRTGGGRRMRSPVSLSRLRFTSGAEQVVYTHKGGHDASEPGDEERIDADEFVARVLVQIPDPRRHLVRYYGAYSNRARGQRRKAEAQLQGSGSGEAEEPVPPPPQRAALRRSRGAVSAAARRRSWSFSPCGSAERRSPSDSASLPTRSRPTPGPSTRSSGSTVGGMRWPGP